MAKPVDQPSEISYGFLFAEESCLIVKSNIDQEVFTMAELGEVLVCELCGNEVTVTKAGGNPEIHCCGRPMKKKDK